jgi:hypothetical protein
LHKHLPITAALLLPALFASCRTMSLADQRLLQQPGMKFGERGALTGECALPGHVERGRALSSSAAGGGCSSCH